MIAVRQLPLDQDNGRFTYHTCGAGPDVLLLHGWISSGRMWARLMEALAGRFHAVAPDLMGFGDSRAADPAATLNIDDQARLVARFCQALDLKPVAVIGHSMGAAVAVRLALDFPELVGSLVLASPVITGKMGSNLDRLLKLSFVPPVMQLGHQAWSHLVRPPLAAIQAASRRPQADRPSRQRSDDLRKATWGASYGGLLSLVNVRLDRYLDQIRVPSLVISGAKDNVIPPSDARLAARLIPDAQFFNLPNCHHHLTEEDPECFNGAILSFLQEQLQEQPVFAI